MSDSLKFGAQREYLSLGLPLANFVNNDEVRNGVAVDISSYGRKTSQSLANINLQPLGSIEKAHSPFENFQTIRIAAFPTLSEHGCIARAQTEAFHNRRPVDSDLLTICQLLGLGRPVAAPGTRGDQE